MWGKTTFAIIITFAGVGVAQAQPDSTQGSTETIQVVAVKPQTDSTQAAPWVPRNMASNLVNGFFIRCPLRPSEATIIADLEEKSAIVNLMGNYSEKFGSLQLGAGSVISSVYSNGNLSRTGDIRLAGGYGTYQFGVTLPFQIANGITGLPPSLHAGLTTSNLRAGIGGSPFKTTTSPRTGYAAADIIFGTNAFSTTVLWNGKDKKVKFAAGVEKKFGSTQIGVSLHPELGFFGEKVNPIITFRHFIGNAAQVDIGYAPKQKRMLIGIGVRR